jgi:hypothetical protein
MSGSTTRHQANSMVSLSVVSEISPAALLGRIQTRFRKLGCFGSPLTLTHNGKKYLAACDDRTFAVYRLVDQGHVAPGRPGWPVCLVTAEAVVDESSPPHLTEDEFASGLSLQEWLDLIESLYSTP